jgi:hypothetical protein
VMGGVYKRKTQRWENVFDQIFKNIKYVEIGRSLGVTVVGHHYLCTI